MSDSAFYIGRFICIVMITLSVVEHYREIRTDINQNKKELKQLSDKVEYLFSESCDSCKNPTREFP